VLTVIISKTKDKLLCEMRNEIETGNIKVNALFEYFYLEIAKAPTKALKAFLEENKKA
jgi:hypothetical protein